MALGSTFYALQKQMNKPSLVGAGGTGVPRLWPLAQAQSKPLKWVLQVRGPQLCAPREFGTRIARIYASPILLPVILVATVLPSGYGARAVMMRVS